MNDVEENKLDAEILRRRRRHRILGGMVGAHILLGLVLPILTIDANPSAASFPLLCRFALHFAQLQLVGIWAGMGLTHWYWRILGVVAVVVTLSTIFTFLTSWQSLKYLRWEFIASQMITIIASAPIIALVFFLIRRTFAQLQCDGDETKLENRALLQFSIRQLMLVTLLVGVATPLGIQLREYLEFNTPGVIMNSVFVFLALVYAWATLGKDALYFRCFSALSTSVLIGLGYEYAEGFREFPTSIVVMICNCAFVVSSLLLVRTCGYRLVRYPPATARTAISPS